MLYAMLHKLANASIRIRRGVLAVLLLPSPPDILTSSVCHCIRKIIRRAFRCSAIISSFDVGAFSSRRVLERGVTRKKR